MNPQMSDHFFANKQEYTVSLYTLSDIIEEQNLARIDLLKIDVEGEELQVLIGLEPRHWRRIQAVSMEVHAEGRRVEECTRLLQAMGFVTWTRSYEEEEGKGEKTDNNSNAVDHNNETESEETGQKEKQKKERNTSMNNRHVYAWRGGEEI